MIAFQRILRTLADANVDFIVVGGVAGVLFTKKRSLGLMCHVENFDPQRSPHIMKH